MSTGNVSERECPRCASINTIQVDRGRAYDAWYCFACTHSFDVSLTTPPHMERRTGMDRRDRTSDGRGTGNNGGGIR